MASILERNERPNIPELNVGATNQPPADQTTTDETTTIVAVKFYQQGAITIIILTAMLVTKDSHIHWELVAPLVSWMRD
jgi:hypothetical protein